MTLLPLIQLQDGVRAAGALFRCEVEMAEAVLGVLVLTKSSRRGALPRGSRRSLVCVHSGELVLRWWRTTREGVVTRWGKRQRLFKHLFFLNYKIFIVKTVNLFKTMKNVK